MTICDQLRFDFKGLRGRKVDVDFKGGDVTSDGGSLLLAEADRNLGLLEEAARRIPDDRVPWLVEHTILEMLRARVYGIALGYEDLNDHGTTHGEGLRHDPLLQSCAGKTEPTAGASTLCRMENRADRSCAVGLNALLVEKFIAAHKETPEEVVLDFDATDDPVHGMQEGRFFHGYYGGYCFLPLYVFCGDHPLCALLRPSSEDGARGAWAVLRALVRRLREAWPDVRIIFRADSGFCRWRMLRWMENNDVGYIVGLARNARIQKISAHLCAAAEALHASTGEKARLLGWIHYAAGTWDRERMVIAKAEHTDSGSNPRYVVTNLRGDAADLYNRVYCARGDMENRIKEQQLGLFADRTSCTSWWPNQLRLLLSTLAYVLVAEVRRAAKDTAMVKAQATTLRNKLLKVGGVIIRNTRRVRVHLSSAYPYREVFEAVARRLLASPA